jgi:hypothetical protein
MFRNRFVLALLFAAAILPLVGCEHHRRCCPQPSTYYAAPAPACCPGPSGVPVYGP